MGYTKHDWVNYHVPAINDTHLNEMEAGIDDAHTLLVPPSQMCFVSADFDTDTEYRKFPKIQDAIDAIHGASWFGDLSDSNKALVKVGPGKYTEQINSYEHIVISSYTSGFDTIDTSPPATLYNTGADSAHYPLRSDEDEIYEIVGMKIETVVGGVIGKIPNGNFYSCRFNGGHFIERNSSNVVVFSNCSVLESAYGGFYFEGTNLTGYRNIILRQNCNIGLLSTSEFLSTHTGFANFKCTDVDVEGSVNIKGDWDWRVTRCYGYRLAQRNIIDTTGSINIVDTIILNGLHFVSNPSSFKMITSSFEGISDNKIPDGEADITADAVITDAIYSGNIQHNGICGCIQIQCPIKSVGCASLNRYFSLQDAIDSIVTSGVIDLRESLTGLAELTIPSNTNVTIDGHKLYSLTFTADVVELQADEQIVFYGLSSLNGGNIEVNGNNAYVGFEECLTANAYVTMTSGTSTYCLVYTSTIKAPTGHPAISLNNVNGSVIAGYSRIQGAAGSPGTAAVVFNAAADTKLKAKFSTFIHGDMSNACPIEQTVGGSINIAMYMCGVNKLWSSPNPFTNVISKAGIIDDTEINF